MELTNQMKPNRYFIDLVRLYPAFEALRNYCYRQSCLECPLYAVCESWVFMSGHDLEDIACEFIDSIECVFIEGYGAGEVE